MKVTLSVPLRWKRIGRTTVLMGCCGQADADTRRPETPRRLIFCKMFIE